MKELLDIFRINANLIVRNGMIISIVQGGPVLVAGGKPVALAISFFGGVASSMIYLARDVWLPQRAFRKSMTQRARAHMINKDL
jgi:hypothetical protein